MISIGEMSTQQKNVYEAERTIDLGVRFANQSEAQAYADALTRSLWWEQRYSHVPRITVEVIESQISDGCASPKNAWIALSRKGCNEATLLHEIAHLLVHSAVGHNAPWAREHLNLTYLARSSEAYIDLLNAYSVFGVEIG